MSPKTTKATLDLEWIETGLLKFESRGDSILEVRDESGEYGFYIVRDDAALRTLATSVYKPPINVPMTPDKTPVIHSKVNPSASLSLPSPTKKTPAPPPFLPPPPSSPTEEPPSPPKNDLKPDSAPIDPSPSPSSSLSLDEEDVARLDCSSLVARWRPLHPTPVVDDPAGKTTPRTVSPCASNRMSEHSEVVDEAVAEEDIGEIAHDDDGDGLAKNRLEGEEEEVEADLEVEMEAEQIPGSPVHIRTLTNKNRTLINKRRKKVQRRQEEMSKEAEIEELRRREEARKEKGPTGSTDNSHPKKRPLSMSDDAGPVRKSARLGRRRPVVRSREESTATITRDLAESAQGSSQSEEDDADSEGSPEPAEERLASGPPADGLVNANAADERAIFGEWGLSLTTPAAEASVTTASSGHSSDNNLGGQNRPGLARERAGESWLSGRMASHSAAGVRDMPLKRRREILKAAIQVANADAITALKDLYGRLRRPSSTRTANHVTQPRTASYPVQPRPFDMQCSRLFSPPPPPPPLPLPPPPPRQQSTDLVQTTALTPSQQKSDLRNRTPEVHEFRRTWTAVGDLQARGLVNVVARRLCLSQLALAYDTAVEAVSLSCTKTLNPRNRDRAKEEMFWVAHPELEGHSPNRHPKTCGCQSKFTRFGHALQFARRWRTVEDRLGAGVFALIPHSGRISNTWHEQSTTLDQFHLWIDLVCFLNPDCIEAGRRIEGYVKAACFGDKISGKRLNLEIYDESDLKEHLGKQELLILFEEHNTGFQTSEDEGVPDPVAVQSTQPRIRDTPGNLEQMYAFDAPSYTYGDCYASLPTHTGYGLSEIV